MILAMLPTGPKMELATQREFVFALINTLKMLKLLIILAKNVQAVVASILGLALLDLVFVASVSTFNRPSLSPRRQIFMVKIDFDQTWHI